MPDHLELWDIERVVELGLGACPGKVPDLVVHTSIPYYQPW